MVKNPRQITFQKKLLSKYAKDHHFPNPKFYVDDGYTGTNFNCPGFQEMIEDIEAGYVTTVIVKDLSRLGRDYIEAGKYTDFIFPSLGCRFIALMMVWIPSARTMRCWLF